MGIALETIPYTYGDSNWKDKLTAYNGQTITYDAIGNPLNDGTWTYTWTSGRQLSQMSKDGMSVLFKYDHNGLRSQKTVTENAITTTTDYIYHGKLLAAMTRGSDVLRFEYDAQSRPTVVMFNGIRYVYLHNIQSDIVGIMDASGNLVVEYRYDAWGKPLSNTGTMAATLGKINPLRYRGYVYDEESCRYYLLNRYYGPGWNRFGNSDLCLGETVIPLAHNAFCYCGNSVLLNADPTGESYIEFFINTTIDKVRHKKVETQVRLMELVFLKALEADIIYNAETGLLRIPNNTFAAEGYIDLCRYTYHEYKSETDYAEKMAEVALNKYERETGLNYSEQTGIPKDKVVFEVRIHAEAYRLGIFPTHSDITDVSPYEGKGWKIHVQDIIDLLYSMGFR